MGDIEITVNDTNIPLERIRVLETDPAQYVYRNNVTPINGWTLLHPPPSDVTTDTSGVDPDSELYGSLATYPKAGNDIRVRWTKDLETRITLCKVVYTPSIVFWNHTRTVYFVPDQVGAFGINETLPFELDMTIKNGRLYVLEVTVTEESDDCIMND